MIPCPISEDNIHTLSSRTLESIKSIDYFIVEKAKTARRFLKACEHPKAISELYIEEMDKHNKDKYNVGLTQKIFMDWVAQKKDIGIISEAGCPGIADPGSKYVQLARTKNAKIIPLVGPSSILLSLMASGLNGQNFSFHGYLPYKEPELVKKLKNLNSKINKENSAEIFIETPYRNHKLFNSIIKNLPADTKLCIAIDITGNKESIETRTIKEWKKYPFPSKEKIPAIFILGK